MEPTLSSMPVLRLWSERVGSRVDPLTDYENGSDTLNSTTTSNDYEWVATSDGASIWVARDGVPPVLILTDTNITRLSLAFDSAMRVHIAYEADGQAKWYFWDTLLTAHATMVLSGARTPMCCTDEKTLILSNDRDVILCYLRGTQMFLRLQRDRYLIEYEKIPNPANHEAITLTTKLTSFGMNVARRLQWRFGRS